MLAPPAALAQSPEPAVVVGDVWLHDGELHISLTSSGILDEEARRTIEQGGTSEIEYTIELFRKRSGWFDASVGDPISIPFRVSYEPFERKYRMLGLDIGLKTDDFQKVVDQVTRLGDVTLGTLTDLRMDMDATYYVVVTMHYQPITVDTLDELRSWMDTGRPAEEGRQRSGKGIGSRIAQALMSAAGFGERQLRGESAPFRPSDLPER